jgi:FkbM family methyltransferase
MINKHKGFGLYYRDERDLNVCREVISRDTYRLISVDHLDVVVDIGAHIGSFAHHAHTLFPQAAIVCAEPVKANFELLQMNAPYARAFNQALWYGHNQPIIYHTEAQTGSDIITDAPEQYEEFISGLGYEYKPLADKVDTTTLGALLLNADIDFREKYTLLKVDAEGAEQPIIEDIAKQNIGHYFSHVCGEWHHDMCGEIPAELFAAAFPHLEFMIFEQGINSTFRSW